MDIDGIYYCSRCMKKMDKADICPHCGYSASGAPHDGHDLEEGTFLNDRYILGAVIGAGGFGVTYAAWDELFNIPVAIKEYFPDKYAYRNTDKSDEIVPHEDDRTLYEIGVCRFRQEAQVLAQFKNLPGVVGVYDFFEENNTCYIVMEYVHGTPLDRYAEKNKTDAKTLIEMMRGPIDALEMIHRQGIQHRDITPANMLVMDDGTIRLIDFGAAREMDHVSNMIVVSDGYAPPEQYDLQQPQGPWGDIYSLSAVLYHMLTGVMPPVSIGRIKHDTLKRPSELGVNIKKHEEKALMAGLAADVNRRVHSMAEFRAMLYNMPLPEEALRRRAFMRRMYAVMAAAVIFAAAVVFNFVHGFPLGAGLLYALYPDGFHAIGVSSVNETVDIPPSYLGIPVTQMKPALFAGNTDVKSVSVPGSVRVLEYMSFSGCTSLNMVVLGEGVAEIGAHAFADCGSLHTAVIPSSVRDIAPGAFSGAWERMMICGRKGSAAQTLAAREGIPFYDREDYEYVRVGGEIHLPDGSCTRMDPFNDGEADETVLVSEGVKLIQTAQHGFEQTEVFVVPAYIDGYPVVLLDEAFRFPPGCRRIVLPEYLEYLAYGAFGRYPDREKCDIEALCEIDLGQKLRNIPFFAFSSSSISSIELPDTVEYIGMSAFQYTPLEEIRLSGSLKGIEVMAFEGTRLNAIDLPDSLESIGYAAFRDTALYEVEFPASLREIGEEAFAGTNLSSLRLAIDVDHLGSAAFSNCARLNDVHLTGVNEDGEHPGGDILARDCFAGSPELHDVILLGDIREIGEGCFRDSFVPRDRYYGNVYMPEGIRSIGKEAFAGGECLTYLMTPGSLEQIDETAFSGCDMTYLTFVGEENSWIGQYAEKNGLRFFPKLRMYQERFGETLPDGNEIYRFLKESGSTDK